MPAAPETIAVRRATPRDAEFIAAANEAMARETEDRVLPPRTIRAGVRNLFRHPAFGFYLVATVAGRPAGTLLLTYEWSDWRDGVFWWIQSVYVLPEYRRRGVFTALYRAVEARAARARPRCCGLRLYLEQSNRRARRTYARLGMTATPYRVMEAEQAAPPRRLRRAPARARLPAP